MSNDRQGWDEYFMGIARTVASRATCPRAAVGSVIVKENRILGTGYNGSVRGHPHCTESGCIIVDAHCIRTIHAEVNALLTALERGRVEGATVFCTHRPCANCTKLLAQSGISRIVYAEDYQKPGAESDFRDSLDIQSELLYTPK